MRSAFGLLSLTALLSLLGHAAGAEDWRQWRGPTGNGISPGKAPTRWSANENVRWKVALPGPGGATPIISGDHIFVTSAKGRDLVLIALDRKGNERWSKTVASGDQIVRGDEGNYASPTPVTDGEHVWTFMGNGTLACYDFAGDQKWKIDLQERYGKFEIQFGLSSTPILHGDRLYLQLIHGKWSDVPSKGHVVALDKKTGNEAWHRVRATDATAECKHSYASPILYRDAEREFLVTHGADYAIAHDLDSGEELWRLGGLNPRGAGVRYHNTLRFVASPAMAEGIIVVPTAKRSKIVAVRPDGKGDITKSEKVRWEIPRMTPDVPSPLIHGGLVYLCGENGVFSAIDAESGEVLYKERTVNDRHRASPVYADGKIYLSARNGTVTVVKAGREFEIISKNSLGEALSASPVIADGVIYLRTFDHLWAIGK